MTSPTEPLQTEKSPEASLSQEKDIVAVQAETAKHALETNIAPRRQKIEQIIRRGGGHQTSITVWPLLSRA